MDRKRSRHLGAEERPSGLTRRSMLALSSTAVLAAALPYGRAQSLSLPLAAEGASVSPVMEKLSAYMSAAGTGCARRGTREGARTHCRYSCGHYFRLTADAGTRRSQVCSRLWRAAGRYRDSVESSARLH